MQKNTKKVALLMSGGVDSSYSAYLLQQLGYEVLLITIFGLVTLIVGEYTSSSSTVALFVIVKEDVPDDNAFTVTANSNVVDPFAGTLTSIPFDKFV